jgi:predicted ArsR family transcriptional regulator
VKTPALVARPAPPVDPSDTRTRDRVTQLLIELGPCTAGELSERLGLSPAAIRRHLDAMCASGVISERTAPRSATSPPVQRGRGRPAKRSGLTEAGHAAGPAAYDELAAEALAFLAEHGGVEAVEQFARRRAEELAERVAARLDPATRPDAAELAGALTAEGYAATVQAIATGAQLCQHHCPVQSVAAQFPQLCEAETAVLSELLDTHVQRLATIAHGDGVCTTHVPSPASRPTVDPADARGRTSLPLLADHPASDHPVSDRVKSHPAVSHRKVSQ